MLFWKHSSGDHFLSDNQANNECCSESTRLVTTFYLIIKQKMDVVLKALFWWPLSIWQSSKQWMVSWKHSSGDHFLSDNQANNECCSESTRLVTTFYLIIKQKMDVVLKALFWWPLSIWQSSKQWMVSWKHSSGDHFLSDNQANNGCCSESTLLVTTFYLIIKQTMDGVLKALVWWPLSIW